MNTQPDTIAINATTEQIDWLNRLGDVSGQYRRNLLWMKDWTESALKATPAVTDIDHQTFTKVQQLNASVGELLKLKHMIFHDLPEEASARRERMAEINEWVKLAREGNPNGLMGLNWFVKEVS